MHPLCTSQVLLAVACLGASQVSAETVRIPVPFMIDRDEIFSSMAMEVERSDLGGTRASPGNALTPDLQAFFQLVDTLRDGDADAVLALCKLAPNENPLQRRQLVEAFQKTFDGQWDSLALRARYNFAGYSTYTWTVDTPRGPFVRSFSLSGGADGFKWVDDSQHDVSDLLDSLLMNAEQLSVEGKDPPVLPAAYRYSEQLRGSGLRLLFNGHVLRWDVFSESIPQLPFARTLHDAYAAFKARDMETFASFWTPFSAQKFLDWINAMPPGEFEAYHADVTGGFEARFIIDADPVVVVYYTTPNGTRYQTLVRDGSTWRLASFYIGGLVDLMLDDRHLFVIPVVGRLAAGDPDPLPLVPAAVQAPPQAVAVAAAPEPAPATKAAADPEPAPAEAAQPASGKLRKAWLLLLIPLIVVILLNRKSRKS